MAPEDRTERINVRVSPREVQMLGELADERGVSSADMVRMLIRDAHRATFPEGSVKKKLKP